VGAHPDAVGAYTAHGPEGEIALAPKSHDHGHSDLEKVIDDGPTHGHSGDSELGFMSDENAMAQLIGVAILEFGVILHRYVPASLFFS
jgi:solute carrier family 39 (zinc transporter), member 1/2/3